MIRTRNLMEAVRYLAAMYPDAIYMAHNRRGCLYSLGQVLDGPPSSGCIIGQAMRLIGDERYNNMVSDDLGGRAKSACMYICGSAELKTPLAKWCGWVQREQDFHTTWSQAVRKADIAMGYIKEEKGC